LRIQNSDLEFLNQGTPAEVILLKLNH